MPLNTTLSPGWRNALSVISSQKTFGDILTKDYLIAQFQLQKLTGHVTEKQVNNFAFAFMEQMNHFVEEMLFQHNMCVFSIGSGKYKILDPSEQTDKNWKRMIKQMRKTLRITGRNISNVALSQLSNHERADNVNKLAALANLKTTLSQGLTNAIPPPTNQPSSLPGNQQASNPQPGNSPNTP